MTTMNFKHTTGIILATTGTLFSFVHLVLMIVTDLGKRYHASEIWAVIGFVMMIAGLVLLIGRENEGGK